jgi:hypothetical protein
VRDVGIIFDTFALGIAELQEEIFAYPEYRDVSAMRSSAVKGKSLDS